MHFLLLDLIYVLYEVEEYYDCGEARSVQVELLEVHQKG